jgi:alpha-beta hydrolase superfamily lysophospholipase
MVAAIAIAVAVAFVAPTAVGAAPAVTVFGGETVSGAAIPCNPQPDGVRVCHGLDGGVGGTDTRLKSFDGTPLEVYVILPAAPATGSGGSYPMVVQSHGWGQSAGGPASTQYLGPTADAWAAAGYAVLQLTARGFGDSCGTIASRLLDESGCMSGYLRLDDDRYEVRDIQTAVGELVDAGLANPLKIGITGESYGGGVTLQLATLRDRVMNADGSTSPWKSPRGVNLSIAAAAPVIPWSDLLAALVPNGRTLDYETGTPTTDSKPFGIEKQSYVAGLYALGNTSGYTAPPLLNPEADVSTWFTTLGAGEPYDGNPEVASIAAQVQRYHSGYYLLDGAYGVTREQPPPLLIANGFTDDLFPVDEAVRYANLENALDPGAAVSLFDGDFGHSRGQNKPADMARLSTAIRSFFDYHLDGTGAPPPGATAYTETCPVDAGSGGPFTAPSWSALQAGEVDYAATGSQTVTSAGADPTIGTAIDPIAGRGACAQVSATDQKPGVATYRLPAAKGSGYTLLGSPAVVANLTVTGPFAYIAARLWDVDPATNTETLVARGVYRIDPALPDGEQVFELHAGAWRFAAGHVPKLELLGQDAPYLRISNGQFAITVSGLHLRLPVHDAPGSAPGVTAPLPPPVAHPRAGAVCGAARPSSKITKIRALTHGLSVTGTASETPCASAGAAKRKRERVMRVYVMVYRQSGSKCIFVRAGGRLSGRRSCRTATFRFPAKGTSKWSLSLRFRIPVGRYFVRADAVDREHVHQSWTAASVTTLNIR